MLSGTIQGKIGCGAGFSGNTLYLPTRGSNFSYAGLVGDRDMNFQEMHKVSRWLSSIGVANELFTYEDNHSLPPPEQYGHSTGWKFRL